MRIYSKIVWQMTADGLELESSTWNNHEGTVAECKGTGTAKDQLKLQNQLVQQQLDQQKALQGQIKDAFGQYLQGQGQGFTPEQQALLEGQFLNENSRNFNSAGQQLKSALLARGTGGGDLPVGGDFVRNVSELEGLRGASQAGGLANIRLQNLQQALANKFNAGSIYQGQGAQLGQNIGAFNSGANNALNQYVYASNQGFGSAFSRAFGNTLGGGLGTGLIGGIGGGISRIPGVSFPGGG